jgi:hypothetical protein
MEKGLKVISPSSSDNEIDEEDEVAIIVKQYGKKGATRIMKLMMKLDELDESLESQEELLRLEREKSEANEDISPLHTMQGPITRACAR